MRTEVIEVDTIDEAVQRILEELEEDNARSTSSGRHNVIYFDGWDGLGASAVLRAVGRCLAPSTSEEEPAAVGRRASPAAAGLEFFKIIHVDCSKWESRRATQRALAVQLQLPARVMGMFDVQDEEDDYNAVRKDSRLEIPEVADAIYQLIQRHLSRRFLVIFNNGSCKEIDLDSLGFPLSGYSRNKALWSFQGRFRLYDRLKVDSAMESTRTTDVVLSAASRPGSGSDPILFGILHYEAAEAVCGINIGDIDWPAAAANCFLYTMKLCSMGSHLAGYDLPTHGSNYWKCDGIIQLQQGDDSADRLWLYGDALQREMPLDVACYQNAYMTSPAVRRLPERIPYWASPTYGFMLIPDQNGYGRIPKGMFQQFEKLCVLKLSTCTFGFTSPPFLCCHGLRFLWLDHCRDESSTDGVENTDDFRRCFQRLWVLDIRYSSPTFLSVKMLDFMTQLRELNVMGQEIKDLGVFQGGLHNIRKVRITKSSFTTDHPTVLFSGKDKMELLDFSGNRSYKRLYVESSCSSLETVIIDGSISLQQISLTGCASLKNLLLSGSFPKLFILDITGTSVKTLDLTAVTAPELDKLFLLDSEKLHAILWPPQDKRKRYLGELRIDTTQKEVSTTVAAAAAAKGRPPSGGRVWYISVRDARLLGSLVPVKDYFGSNSAHVDISTTTLLSPARPRPHADAACGNRGGRTKSSNRQQAQGNLQRLKDHRKICYADVAAALKDTSMQQQADESDDDDVWDIMWVCPAPPQLPHYEGCYMHIEDEDKMMRTKLPTVSRVTVPGFICDSAKVLHVHHSLFLASILAAPFGSTWNQLEWCRVERCPKLERVFSPQLGAGPEGSSGPMEMFKELRTIWVSHLPNARYILEYPLHRAFEHLRLLHIYCCPRLVYAIPLPSSMMVWNSLETLEIMWCGDLSGVIGDYTGMSHTIFIGFPRLKHIHLHELPMLRGILNIPSLPIFAPYLETVKIRGCWSLRTMPFDLGEKLLDDGENLVKCDCEKEWWDRLEWRRREKASRYKLIHPRYYKKIMLRGSPLR